MNLSEKIQLDLTEKLNKQCFFSYKDHTKVGIFKGIIRNNAGIRYLLINDDKEYYIYPQDSITLVYNE